MKAVEELSRTILLCRDYVADTLSDEEIYGCLRSVRVLCVSDRRNLSSQSGQTALVTLVSLLNRMGMQVELAIPDLAMVSPQPPLLGSSIRDALINSSETLITGATVSADSGLDPGLTFVLGDTQERAKRDHSWRLSGGHWYGALAMDGRAEAGIWNSKWSVGAMVSAALAAAEAFKYVIRRLPLRSRADQIFFEPSPTCSWDFGNVPVPDTGVDLGDVDVVSAGAICQAALYALMRLPWVRMRGRIFDDDVTGSSNLNRNMLTVANDVNLRKVLVVARRCGMKLKLEAIADRFTGAASGLGKLAPRVLVGVDDIPSRWAVQRCWPGWLAASGTSHFSVSSSSHGVGMPCCGCLHPADDTGGGNPIPTISFVSFWAGLAMAVRLLREALGSPYPPDQQHLWLTPLRLDQPRAAMWLPVAFRRDCPVPCPATRAVWYFGPRVGYCQCLSRGHILYGGGVAHL